MKLGNLRQPPHNTTMMGVMRGALDFYGIPCTDGFLYGASGHAFVINIHKQLCPSGPYCWNRGPVNAMLANVGLKVTGLGFFHAGSSAEDRAKVEAIIRENLDAGVPCALLNMENQLITGYDDTGFLTAQPWSCNDFPPAHLTFGSWAELGGEIHVDFTVLAKSQPIEPKEAVIESLRYAVELQRNPTAYTSEDYGVGPNAYANWCEAVQNGHGGSHGNWWNGTVWAECRARAADYFREIAPLLSSAQDSEALAEGYAKIANLISRCSDKELAPDDKIGLLKEAAAHEKVCVERIESLLPKMA
jgi:hypothetical protein